MKAWIDKYNQWLIGSISTNDRYDLEKRSLDDPLIADALEGIEKYQKSNKSQVYQRLNDRLLPKKKSREILLWPYSVAAALLALITSLYILQIESNSFSSKTYQDITSIENHPQEESILAFDPDIKKKEKSKNIEVKNSEIKVDQLEESQNISEFKQSSNTHKLSKETARQAPSKLTDPAIPSKSSSISDQVDDNQHNASDNSSSIALISSEEIDENISIKPLNEKTSVAASKELILLTRKNNRIDNSNIALLKDDLNPTSRTLTQAYESADVNNIASNSTPIASGIKIAKTYLSAPELNYLKNIPKYPRAAPKKGWQEFNNIIYDRAFGLDELVERGIQPEKDITINFELDQNNLPKKVQYNSFPKETLDQIFEAAGPWENPENLKEISLDVPVTLRKR